METQGEKPDKPETSTMSNGRRPPRDLAVNVFSGAGLGLLLGVVVGLSTSPVVAIVVGALTSLLAVFLGLESGGDSKVGALAKVQLNGVRIGSFGLATVLGLILGLYVRVSNPFAEPPEQQLKRWQDAFPDNPALARQLMIFDRTGITPSTLKYDQGLGLDEPPEVQLKPWQDAFPDNPTLARQMMIFERTGITPATLKFDKGPGVAVKLDKGPGVTVKKSEPGPGVAVQLAEGAAARRAGLFAGGLQSTDWCTDINPERWKYNGQIDVKLGLQAYDDRPEPLPTVAAKIKALPGEHQPSALVAVHAFVCEMEELEEKQAPK